MLKYKEKLKQVSFESDLFIKSNRHFVLSQTFKTH